ncbi:MAG: ABC transporter ATP-binding protein [Candidatus Micrarchaeota archaeon]|nr:ABC transporter ATP-binding protein [Candidatus Micrarchaeota archaeon]
MKGLVCRNISKRYPTGKVALKSMSLSVESKGIFALIGRNGAGKTTLVRILATQMMPTSGTASIDGIDIIREPGRLRQEIAIVPQEARAIPWLTPMETVYSYLLWRGFESGEAKKRARKALNDVGMGDQADKMNQYLSGGMKRKVLVATVIASEARIIFLDEPTTGLDPISRSDLWKMLAKLKKERFIFLTTHYLDEAEKLADSIAIVEEGKLVASGTIEELRGKVKYPYSIKLLDGNTKVPKVRGKVIKGLDGSIQILTGEDEAYSVSKELIKKGTKFALGPLTLDDIFYSLVRKKIEGDDDGDEEENW